MDTLLNGLSTTAVGMLVVFSGLTILIACITVMGMIMGGKKKKKAEKPAAPVAPVAEAPVEEVVEEENDDALIAVISAAVAAMWQDESTGFVVRRIKRYPGQKR